MANLRLRNRISLLSRPVYWNMNMRMVGGITAVELGIICMFVLLFHCSSVGSSADSYRMPNDEEEQDRMDLV